MSLSKDLERRPECRKVQCRHFLAELNRRELVFVGREFLPIPHQIQAAPTPGS